MHDVSVSTIILRTDDKRLNEKGIEVSLHLKEISKEKNIFLMDNSKNIKAPHFYEIELHLTKHSSRKSSKNFTKETPKVLLQQVDGDNRNTNVEKCNFKDYLTAKLFDKCNITLKTTCSDNVNKLIFPYLNINSIRNKFKLLATQVKSKLDILMISETEIDKSFPKESFLIESFIISCRLNHDSEGEEITLSVREDTSSNFITFEDKPI